MKYKMIVSDYDNTICNSKKIVSQRTRTAIKNYIDNGGRFVICTARPYISIVNQAKDIGLKDEVIANQGATVRILSDDSVLFQSLFDTQEAVDLVSYFEEKSSHIFVSSDYEMKSRLYDFFVRTCERMVNFPIQKTDSDLRDECRDMDVAQFIIGSYNPQKVIKLDKIIKRELGEKYEVGICDKFLLNITQKGVSKGSAIEKIANIHGIKKEEIVAVGDSPNDSSMFEYAGVGVAMGNAMPGLKKLATTVCGDVKNDGLAEFIESNCL